MDDSNVDQCSICLAAISDRAVVDPCFHAFDQACIRKWCEAHQTCPICRVPSTQIMADIQANGFYNSTIPVEPASDDDESDSDDYDDDYSGDENHIDSQPLPGVFNYLQNLPIMPYQNPHRFVLGNNSPQTPEDSDDQFDDAMEQPNFEDIVEIVDLEDSMVEQQDIEVVTLNETITLSSDDEDR